MSEAVPDNKEDTMGVVVGDQQEGEKEDVVLIPEQEGDHEIRKTFKGSFFSGVSLTLTGIIIIVITALVWGTAYIPWFNTAAPILWIIIGIFIATHGVIAYCEPPQMYSLEVIVNEKQFSRNLPLKHILLSTTNVIFGLTGIITMSTVGPCCEWPAWNIIGLTLSILVISVPLISSLKSFSKTRRMMNIPHFNLSETKLKKSAETAAELLTTQLEIFSKLLPLPSVESLSNLDQVMKQPRKITNKPAHVLCILLAMIVCVVMFTAQLWDVATMDCTSEQGCYFSFDDPDNAFARNWVFGSQVSDRKLAILISTPIAFLLCTMLLLLMKGSTVLRMLFSGIICLVIGIFFFGFSLFSVQYIIMMGVQFSSLTELLLLVSLLPIPLLSSLFLALAYGNIVQLKEEKEAASSDKTKIYLLSISFILAIVFLCLSLATMTSSNLVTVSSMQRHWNSTNSQSWDEECRENNRDNDRYNYNQRRDYELTTTTAPKTKPEKCYGKQLNHEVQDVFVFFSISQLCLTEVVLFLSLFVFLTGRRITKKSLFFPGILLFAAAISTIIAFFSGVVHYNHSYENGSPFLPFLLLNGINTFSALVIGFICIVIGGSLFISIMKVLSRIILSILVFVFILFLTLLQAFLKLASHVSKNKKEHNTEKQPEVTLA